MTFQTVRNKDGTVLDSSEGKGTLDFIVGSQQVMPRLEEAVVGMSAGDSQDVDISGVFGERDPERVANVPVDQLPPAIVPGTQLTVQGPSGPMPATVAKIGETEAVLDFNHPWAGEELTMKVTMVEVLPPGAPIPGQEGLEVKTLSPGDGKTYPKAGDQLEMHYTGTLAADGTKFDSSVDRGEPFSFTIGVGQVILGWDVGVMKMSLGEKAELRIPSSMGYGERGAGGVIPPNADLVFEVELLSIN
jgi:FK506-binding protein 1